MAAKRKKPTDGDSPIKVGGGGGKKPKVPPPVGIEMEFDHGRFAHGASGNDTYENPTLSLDSLEIIVNNVATPVTVNEGSKIEIKYRKFPSIGPKITINDKPDRFGVKFNEGHLPIDFQDFLHKCPDCRIEALKVDGSDVSLPATRPLYIVAHTKFKPPKRQKKR
jgi:hypothetical protein